MPTISAVVVHPDRSDNRNRQYQFTPKHHGADPNAAQWLPDLMFAEEFAVFNSADQHDLADDRDWLYGLQRTGDSLRRLGTCAEQIAEFPFAPEGQAWHGYPIWPVNDQTRGSRRGEKMRPAKEVFLEMEQAGLLTSRQRKRLFKGDHV